MNYPIARTVRQHPFVNHIMEAYIHLGWKPLNLKRYDGTIDLDEHLDAFLTQANLYTNNDVILCRIFPTPLKGTTLTRYGELLPRSINCFDTLVERFSMQYATSRSHCMTLAALANLQQADDESLREFMDRFRCTTIQIRNLNPKVVLHSILLALRPNKFTNNLCKKNYQVAWTNYTNKPRPTSIWKKCSNSRMKSTKLDRSVTSAKQTPRPTCTSRTRGTSQTSTILSPKGPSTSVTHPWRPIVPRFSNKHLTWRYPSSYPRQNLWDNEDCWALKDKIQKLI